MHVSKILFHPRPPWCYLITTLATTNQQIKMTWIQIKSLRFAYKHKLYCIMQIMLVCLNAPIIIQIDNESHSWIASCQPFLMNESRLFYPMETNPIHWDQDSFPTRVTSSVVLGWCALAGEWTRDLMYAMIYHWSVSHGPHDHVFL